MQSDTFDSADIRILSHLQMNAKASNNELAEIAFLSASQCHRRVKRLEELGVIEGYSARINAKAIGLGITIFVNVSLDAHGPHPAQSFTESIRDVPEVIECYSVTGETDYLIKARLANLDAMSEFLMHRLMQVTGVGSIKTSVVVEEIQNNHGLPLQQMDGLSRS